MSAVEDGPTPARPAGADVGAEPDPPAGDPAWRRMHPATPAIKGWKVLVGVLTVLGFQVADDLRPLLEDLGGKAVLVVLGGVAAITLVGFLYSLVAWRMTRFAITDDAVHLHSGILFRQQRQARLDRLQAVDIVQPLLARLAGLAELRLDVAGGSGSNVSLAFLREADAQALRTELLALAAGLRRPTAPEPATVAATSAGAGEPGGATAPAGDAEPVADAYGPFPASPATTGPTVPSAFEDAPERFLYEVPPMRVVVSALRSTAFVVVAVGLVALGVAIVQTGDLEMVFFALPALLGSAGVLWNRVNRGVGFRGAISPDGIRLRHGLTETRSQTVPPGRIQAVRISQGPWWRGPDWWSVEINVAGYAGEGENQSDTVLHPVATRDEALLALWLAVPDLGVEDARALVDAGLTGVDDEGGFLPSPRSARWVDPVGRRRRGVRVTPTALLVRSGRFWRRLDVVPHERTQSLGLEQGPVQRRLGLASFVVHSTQGKVQPHAEHLDGAVAAALLDEQAARARTARTSAVPEQWMRGR